MCQSVDGLAVDSPERRIAGKRVQNTEPIGFLKIFFVSLGVIQPDAVKQAQYDKLTHNSYPICS